MSEETTLEYDEDLKVLDDEAEAQAAAQAQRKRARKAKLEEAKQAGGVLAKHTKSRGLRQLKTAAGVLAGMNVKGVQQDTTKTMKFSFTPQKIML